ncbi:hypothetical protein LOC59_12860 [Arthrobacter sp. zg-Y916]|uniref:hypothetical protein n=1 Tax=Arthrobacter sp. zg-Y916 TaxID=2894190 RepID=UPI001E2F2517|nr:hypothetical protein [Arthrobacter sp. zg-Y916]MCC9194531.1 hypothetical protein [Arthrobacter sp. zg-Y916]
MRRTDPRSLCVIAAGIVLAAGSAVPPPPAAPAAGPPAGGAELSAAEIVAAQEELLRGLLGALGPAGWTSSDGTAYAEGTLQPQVTPCTVLRGSGWGTSSTGTGPRRQVLTTRLTGPAPESAVASRDQAQHILGTLGTEMLSALTPGPEAAPSTDFTYVGSHSGVTVRYAANDYRQSVEIVSGCSSDPAHEPAAGKPLN